MAGQIFYDLLDGFSVATGLNAESLRRPFRIEGLESGPDALTLTAEAYALIPDKGTAVPAPLVGLILDNADIDTLVQTPNSVPARWECYGSIVYRTPTVVAPGITVPDRNGPGVTVSTTQTTQEYETDLDIDGVQITTSYDGVTQAHRVRRLRNLRTHVFVRPEEQNPRDRRDTHQETLNEFSWNGYPARTVLCQQISDRTRDNATWDVEYTFVYRSDGWTERVAHEDPLYPGQPLPAAGLSSPEQDAAFKDVDVYAVSNFGNMNIVLT